MSRVNFKFRGVQLMKQAEGNIAENILYDNGRSYEVSKLPWDTPVSGTIYGTLLNYSGAFQKMESAMNEPPYMKPPKAPILYIKPKNTIIAYGMPIPIPNEIRDLEMGAALGVVIGRTATRVPKARALEFIEGYTIVNDVTIPHESMHRPPIKQKCRDGFCPVGPWIVTKDGIDPDDLRIKVFINQELKQENTTAHLIRSVSDLISDISEFMTLNKGDIVLVGIPENPPRAKAGDHVRIEIEQIGQLENIIVEEEKLFMGVKL